MRKFFLLALCCFSISLHAQKLHLKSGNFVPNANVGSIENFSNWTGVQFRNQTYCIVQFSKSTTQAERNLISKESGIQFFDYIPRWAFIAAVPSHLDVNTLSQYHIRSVLPYQAEYKLPLKLKERPLPSWIIKENQQVEILVYFFSNIPKESILSELAKHKYQFKQWYSNEIVMVQIAESEITTIATLPWVKLLQPTDAPAELDNIQGRSSHRTNVIDAAYATGMHYDGTGVSVAVGDDGGIGPHIDFRGRLFHHPANLSMGGTHADHVCGIVAGAGNQNPVATGNGKGADLHIYDDYGNLTNAGTHYDTYGVRITSNSLGQGCNDGYNNSAVSADNLINSKPSLLSVHSSGNSGNTNCGGVGQGFYTITGGYKAGKNVIAVGNLEKDDDLAASSSRGPSEDGRIKPEVCAVGTNVFSTQPDNDYDNLTGTSMACPAVAGTLADLWQAYRDNNAGADPNSALMKALLLNSADDLGNKGPDFRFGFGRINARRAVKDLVAGQYFIDSVDNGGVKNFNITVPAGAYQLKVMLYWHDITGNPGNSNILVNDLDVSVSDPSMFTYRPWVLNNAPNVALLNAPAVRFRDSINNVEQVTIDSMINGVYTITVGGTDIPQGPQVFVITYEFIYDSLVLTYPQGGESFANGVGERVRWDAYGNNLGTFTLEYSSDAGANWNVLSSNIPADRRYYDWTPPGNLNTGQMLMRISRGAVSDISDTLFSVIGIPTGLSVDTACGSDFHLVWNALPNANGYKIYQLGAKYMQEIGSSVTNEFYITAGVNTTDTFYFAVAALETTNGANGRRCNAYRKLPGEINCLDDAYNISTTLPFQTVYPCASSGTVPVKMKLQNIGLRNLFNIPVYYQVNANPIVAEVIPGPLFIGDTMTYTFSSTVNMLTAGVYNVKTWVHTTADINNLNDTSMATTTVLPPTMVTPPMVQDFEGALFPPTGWGIYDYDTSVKWQKIFCLSGANPGNTHAAYMDFFNYQSKNAVDDLETPMFDLVNVTADSVILSFDVAHAYGPLEQDTLSLWVSPVCNNSFIPLNYKKWGVNLATMGMMNTIFSPTATTQWRNDRIDLSAYKGQQIFVRFRGSNNKGNNLYIDNINLIMKSVWPLGLVDTDKPNVRLYPNPSDGNFILDISTYKNTSLQWVIYNVAGQVIKSNRIDADKGTTKSVIDISAEAAGFYLMEISDGVHTTKIKLSKL